MRWVWHSPYSSYHQIPACTFNSLQKARILLNLFGRPEEQAELDFLSGMCVQPSNG